MSLFQKKGEYPFKKRENVLQFNAMVNSCCPTEFDIRQSDSNTKIMCQFMLKKRC